jgi:CheY-like chemotaxis protein/anti-sigma regulatory factor (Ser/Thr protein kinase)
LRQVLSNLLSNALKFTEAGGVVVTISASVESPLCVLRGEVTDTGIGIPPDRIEKLFKVFSQVDSSTTRRFGGTGLGLAICARLCEAMSGDIDVDSEPGRGSSFRFTVRMPLAERKETQDAKPVVPIEGNLERLRVLVVEDVSANRFVIRSMLLRLGIPCDEAHDGAQALDRMRRANDFSLILMDVQMPVMDGLEATRNIRLLEADRGLARTPVIGLTAGVLTSELEKCIDAGMNEVLSKPISLRSLRAALLRYLPLQ